VTKESLTGCTSANFHEAGRSEYLAHYVFSSFGTSVPVPRQEDTGLDLICTLTERDGQRLWPVATYSVQVKSTRSPWVFADKRSIRWIVEAPMPVFFCIVDKRTAKVSIFNTWPRFLAWVMSDSFERIEMTVGESGTGKIEVEINRDGTYSLSAPIAEFAITDILDAELHSQIRSILQVWIQYDQSNIHRIQSGIKSLTSISNYETNNPSVLGVIQLSRPMISDFSNDPKFSQFVEHLKWVARSLAEQKELKGFLRAALLLRHLDALNPIINELDCYPLLLQLEKDFPFEGMANESSFAGLDGLGSAFDTLTNKSVEDSKLRMETYIKSGSWRLPDESLEGNA
jgi:hypothetical protein